MLIAYKICVTFCYSMDTDTYTSGVTQLISATEKATDRINPRASG
jgi:hypothetical protein